MAIPQENLVTKATRNERWARKIAYAHLIVEAVLFVGGVVDSLLRQSVSPFLGLAALEFPIALTATANAMMRENQKIKVS